MQHFLIFLSSVLVLFSYLIYEWTIFHGQTRPHRTTRFVLMIITTLGASSLFAESDQVGFWLIAMMAINSVVLFLISLKYGVGGWAKTDLLCLVIALIGIVTWRLTNNPALGLYSAVIADFAGMIPTIIKTYHQPTSEYGLFFLLDVFAASLTLVAITNWEPQSYAYPVYILVINFVMTVLTQRPKLARIVA